MRISILTCFLTLNVVFYCNAQNVVISESESTADSSAILDVQSTKKGVLFPRLTSAQRDAIVDPVAGLMIYNTTRICFEHYSGVEWTSAVPAGTIRTFGGPDSAIPDGWMLCDGRSLSENEYKDLFAAIGYSWGKDSNSSGRFNIPDLRGRFLRGTDLGSGNDPEANARVSASTGGNTGDNVGSYQSSQFSVHDHSAGSLTNSQNGLHGHELRFVRGAPVAIGTQYLGNGSGDLERLDDQHNRTVSNSVVENGNHTHNISGKTAQTGGLENRPVNLSVNFIIKY